MTSRNLAISPFEKYEFTLNIEKYEYLVDPISNKNIFFEMLFKI